MESCENTTEIQNPTHESSSQIESYPENTRQMAIYSMFKISSRYHCRYFWNSLISWMFSSLKKINNKQYLNEQPKKNIIDWSFRSLHQKNNKNQQEQMLYEFISMCATKIQSTFKRFITQKRHKLAMKNYTKFKEKMSGLIKGWKVRRILGINYFKSLKPGLAKRYAQIEKEISGIQNQKEKFSIRKLQYLRSSYSLDINQLHEKYNMLYSNGNWVFQIDFQPIKKIQEIIKKRQIRSHPISFQNIETKPKRQRQFNRKKPKRQLKSLKEDIQPQQEFQKVVNNDFQQQRPIKAKGAYVLDEKTLQKAKQQMENQMIQSNMIENENENERKKVIRNQENKKLQKRKQYDPRKAIEQGKKKKQLETKEQIKTNNSVEAGQKQDKIQKEKKQKGQTQNRSTILLGVKKNQSKAQSKIDCWGSRQTVNKKIGEGISSKNLNYVDEQFKKPTRKTQYSKLTKEALTAVQQQEKQGKWNWINPRSHQNEKIQRKQQFSEPDEVQSRLREISEYQQKMKNNFQNPVNQVYNITSKQTVSSSQNMKKADNSYDTRIPKKEESKPKRVEIYRPIIELEEVYQSHYSKRLATLMSKLSISNRSRQNYSQIPTLQNYLSQENYHQMVSNQKFHMILGNLDKEWKQFLNS